MNAMADLKSQFQHAVLPVATGDEFARQEFVKSLKLHLASEVSVGNKDAFEARGPGSKRPKGGLRERCTMSARRCRTIPIIASGARSSAPARR